MRFVPTKTVERQSCLMLHRARHIFASRRPSSIQSAPISPSSGSLPPSDAGGVEQVLEVGADPADRRLLEETRACLAALASQPRALTAASSPGINQMR
jgi:transposase